MGVHRRHKSKALFVLPMAGVLLAGILLVWIFFPGQSSVYGRETIILAANPMTVFSWDNRTRNLLLVSFPADMTAEGTHGYGTYSLEAFWRLGEIDKKDGTVLSESVSEALGIPVRLFIGPKTGMFSAGQDPFTLVKQTFSFSNLWAYAAGRLRTNIHPRAFLSYIWLMSVTKPGRVDTFDFTRRPADIAREVELPDGSRQWVVDAALVDNAVKMTFEDDRVRQELVSVAVYNTTQIPSLGTRVARLLGHIGVGVVSVGNDAPEVSDCSLTGTLETLKTMSARVITDVLGCTQKEASETGRADLVVRIGSSYAKRFLPN
ncbi:hypothetical protein A2363_03620 [Candidatus Gottesmanbacteria bacterium RIFOXYB1_FULL_47_11]|uniref:LytR/CpsA/Psr regulator C-terminal domain-containing protein n=1 Tax=Candidatus Gottesmanbacteria bacterium RIFOXYB1_FULL_47_11 TaxID=1798401 RepID=A0A1F6BFS5_9BACT|nr:MAG: hypothetical protein A2363_03620 [Candidatus Gottesmanbacteria bacterium RIFOXYB1_FULL_47_11]